MHPAARLYTGGYFKASLRLAKLIASDEKSIFILSAKYGVVGLQERIEQYDLKLSQLEPTARQEWFRAIRQRIAELTTAAMPVFVCGQLYHSNLDGFKVLPMGGIGTQLQFMNRLILLLQKQPRLRFPV